MANYPDNLDQYMPTMDGTTLTRPPTAADIAARTAAANPSPGSALGGVWGIGPKWGNIPIWGRTLNGSPPAPATPPATQNAVRAATANTVQEGDVRKFDSGVANPAAPPGGSVTSTGLPYTSVDQGNGITRFNVAGQSPLFTNLGVNGLEDMQRMGPALPSTGAFLSGLQEGDLYPPAAGSATAGLPTMASPHASQIASLESQAAPYLQSQGIAANWRGRMLMRQARQLDDEDVLNQNANSNTTMAGARALSSQNEFPLALMHDITAQRGQDYALAPHLPQLQIQQAAAARLQKGDMEGARQLLTLAAPRSGFQPRGFTPITDATGAFAGVLNRDTGQMIPATSQDAQNANALRTTFSNHALQNR